MSRRGFVLPLALAIMVAVSIGAVTALTVATADFQANRATRRATRALLTAEAGARRTVARWGNSPFGALIPGDSAASGWIGLPDGSLYQSVVLRVDDGAGTPLYRVLTEGRPSRQATARRRILTMVRGGGGGSLCCRAAAVVGGDLRVRAPNSPRGGRGRGGAGPQPPMVDGRDHVPMVWAGFCPAMAPATAGVTIRRSQDLDLERDATLAGSPEILVDASLGPSAADVLGTTTFAALAARANVVFSGNERFRSRIGPSARNGQCDLGDDLNWGAPETPASVCWDYLPIIHAQRDLRIDEPGQGQGILLVEGDLDVRDDFRFYGLVVVKGTLDMRDVSITGGRVVGGGGNGNGRSEIRDDGLVEYSSCAVARASAGLGSATFLDGRHWFEIP